MKRLKKKEVRDKRSRKTETNGNSCLLLPVKSLIKMLAHNTLANTAEYRKKVMANSNTRSLQTKTFCYKDALLRNLGKEKCI